MSRFLSRSKKATDSGHKQQVHDQNITLDVGDETLRQFRARQGLMGGSEALVDWGTVEAARAPLKEGFLQSQGGDGAWTDVRVVLTSSYLSIQRSVSDVRVLDQAVAQLQQEPEREVVIYKIEGEPLGISIKGGKEHDLPILISEVKEGSAMARSRKCFVGDEVLAVEDEPLADLEHSEASALLRNAAGSMRVRLRLRFFPAARHRILADYLRSGDVIPLDERSTEWHQIAAVPLDCAVISRFISTTDEPMALGAFTVRAASDLNKAVNLRPPYGDESITSEWIAALRHARDNYPCPMLRKPKPPLNFSGLVLRMGRVHERLVNGRWRDFFLVLTDHDVTFHTSLPTKPEHLEAAVATYPLLALRHVSGKRNPDEDGIPLDRRELEEGCFFIRLPGGLRHYFSAGSQDNERRWANLFSERIDNAVRLLESITYSAYLNGDEVALTLNWQSGLWLNHDARGNKALIWHHTYLHLKHTNDDTETKTLELDFGKHGGLQRIQVENPSLVVFVLTNFISCHVRTREAIKVIGMAPA